MANRYVRSDWPSDLDPRTICLSVDVEWAAPDVLADLVGLFDERNIPATFFCTHDGIDVGHHERGLHPNFRPTGDTLKRLRAQSGEGALLDDNAVFRHVLTHTMTFAPEARGVRGHSLHYDSMLLPHYAPLGLEYDSTYLIPLVGGLRPFWKEFEVLELPIWLNDFFELKTQALGFNAAALSLDQPGLKVVNLHPNTMMINAQSEEHYAATRAIYHDAELLRAARRPGRGLRDFALDLLDRIANERLPVAKLGEVSRRWRASA